MDIVYRRADLGSMHFLSGPLAGNTFPINKTPIKIGREPSNDIVISDPTVSRIHAQLLYNRSKWIIEKLSPQNSLLVNKREVHTAIINDHDIIDVGPKTSFLFISWLAVQNPTGAYPQPNPQQPPYPPPSPQHKNDAKVMWVVLGVLGIVVAGFAVTPLLVGVLIVLALPVLLIWALVTNGSQDTHKTSIVPYQGISQGIIQQEQNVIYDSYNTDDSYNTYGQHLEQHNITVHCHNFIYYGQQPRGMIGGPNVIVDEENEEQWEY